METEKTAEYKAKIAIDQTIIDEKKPVNSLLSNSDPSGSTASEYYMYM